MALVVLSGKVTPETKEQFQTTMEESGARTHNAFIEVLLENWLNPKTVEVPTPTAEQLQALELKDNEIGRLKMELDQLKENSDGQTQTIHDLERENRELKEQQPPEPQLVEKKLEANQEILTFPTIVAAVLDKEREIANRQTGKNFSRGDLLIDTFWTGIVKGAAYPLKVWGAGDLVKIKKQLEAAPNE